ncbi:MAG: sensor histidine kinase [Pseudobdellovibrionaceae bacterium]
MRAFVFEKPLNALSTFLFFSILLSLSIYALLNISFYKATKELVDLWYQSESISLQQSNYLSSITKLQRTLKRSDILRGVLVKDEIGNDLIIFGETHIISNENFEPIVENFFVSKKWNFKNIFFIKSGRRQIFIFTAAPVLLILVFVLILYFMLIGLLIVIWVHSATKRAAELRKKIEFNEMQSQLQISEAIADLAKQVAHDVRSPLTAIHAVIENSDEIGPQNKELLISASVRIKSILNDLLTKKQNTIYAEALTFNRDLETKIVPAINSIILEKIKAYPTVKIDFVEPTIEVSVNIPLSDFQRMISNLLQNSIESTVNIKHPQIDIRIDSFPKKVVVYLVDNGCGVPANVLKKIGEKGYTHGKSNGTGLGVYSSKSLVQKYGGSFQISSSETDGTIVCLTLLRKSNDN